MGTEAGPVVAVTGASGYIGTALCQHLVERAVIVRGLSRRAPSVPGVTHVDYDLRRPVSAELLEGVDVCIHAAAETFRGADPDSTVELSGLEGLLNAAEASGSRFVFISSQTARTDAPTGYGRLKAEAEKRVLARGGLVVRPGQVYGGPEKGLWGSLTALAKHAPLIPRFLPEPVLQPVHVDDLAVAIGVLAFDLRLEPRIYAIADSRPINFSVFLSQVARIRFNRAPLRLPVPLAPIFLAERLVAAVGLRLEFARRLKSLSELPTLDSAADMHLLSLPRRPFPSGVGRTSRNRKALLLEGAILLRYLLDAKPSSRLIRRYVNALHSLGETQRLQIGFGPRLLPCLLSVFDQPGARRRAGSDDTFSRRTDLALLLAESSTRHVDGFLLSHHFANRLAQIGSVVLAIFGEAVARVIDLVFGRIWLDRIRPRTLEAENDDL